MSSLLPTDFWLDGGVCVRFVHRDTIVFRLDYQANPRLLWTLLVYEREKNIWGGFFSPSVWCHNAVSFRREVLSLAVCWQVRSIVRPIDLLHFGKRCLLHLTSLTLLWLVCKLYGWWMIVGFFIKKWHIVSLEIHFIIYICTHHSEMTNALIGYFLFLLYFTVSYLLF